MIVKETEKPKVKLTGDWNDDLTRGLEVLLAMKELKQAGFEVDFLNQDNESVTLIYEHFSGLPVKFVGLDKIRYFIKNFGLYKKE